MATFSVSVPDDLRERMRSRTEINWSAVAKHAFAEKLALLEKLDELAEKSELSPQDAVELGRIIRRRSAGP